MEALIALMMVAAFFVAGIAFSLAITALLTYLACWVALALFHVSVPFWPMFGLIFLIKMIFGGSSVTLNKS